MLADVDKASEERTGLITVATVPSAACYFMPDVIRRFQSRYPRVRIKLIDSSAGNVMDAVARSQADFGICFAGNLSSEIEFFPLVEDVYVAACRRDHPLAQKSQLTWQAFFQQDYISLDKTSGNRNLLDRLLGDIIPERPSVCETRHVTTMLGMVEAGDRHCCRSRHVDADVRAHAADPFAAGGAGGEAYRGAYPAPGAHPVLYCG